MAALDKESQFLIETLFKQMYRNLLVYAQNAFSDMSLAEEAVQDTFQIACTKIQDISTSPNPNGWLVKTLKYVISNKKKKLANQNTLFISDRALDQNIEIPQHTLSIELEVACIEILGADDYKIFKRVTLKESTIREAAREFGLSEEACSKRVQRSKKKLQKIFKEDAN